MVSFTDLRCRRLVSLVESVWRGATAEIFSATEEKIVFRIRSIGGRYRTDKLTLNDGHTISREWLAEVVYDSILG